MVYAQLRVVPNPATLTFFEWASTVVGYNNGLHNLLSPEMDWHDFAQQLALAYPAAPRSDLFSSWQDWADTLCMTLQL